MRKHPLFWLPNALTIIRCGLGVAVAMIIVAIAQKEASMISVVQDVSLGPQMRMVHQDMIADYRMFWGGVAFVIFVIAAVSDFLDGFLARRWRIESTLGRLLDPIADKITVGLPLLAIAAVSGWSLPLAAPAIAIVFRDVFITVLRFAGLGASRMAVSMAAKTKTFLEMIVIALFLVLLALVKPTSALFAGFATIWIVLLWVTALLSVYTGLQYLLGLMRPAPPEPQPQTTEIQR